MSKSTIKNLPGLKLTDLIRRRRLSLKQFVDQFGITTYQALDERCHRMGVSCPSHEEWSAVAPQPVNSPTEGVVVLDPPPVVKESSGKPIDPDTNEVIPAPPAVEVVVLTDTNELTEWLPDGTGEHVGPPKLSSKKSKKKNVDSVE